MEAHDYYYDFSDNMATWRKGNDQKIRIMQLLLNLPHNEARELLKLVPDRFKAQWKAEVGLREELLG
jgi:hypothetical protein